MMLHLYRKVIPKISHDVVRHLRSREYAEIEDTQVIEAELDLSTVMVDYMNKQDRINQEAKAGLQRRSLSPDRFAMVKKSIAEVREFPLAVDGIEFVTSQLLDALFDSGNVEEIYGSDGELVEVVKEVLDKHLCLDEEIDRNVRAALRNVPEGSAAFESEYQRRARELKRRVERAKHDD